jgi:hypothetical protein
MYLALLMGMGCNSRSSLLQFGSQQQQIIDREYYLASDFAFALLSCQCQKKQRPSPDN